MVTQKELDRVLAYDRMLALSGLRIFDMHRHVAAFCIRVGRADVEPEQRQCFGYA